MTRRARRRAALARSYKKKFDSLGLDVAAEEIFSSSFAAAAYLEQTKFKDTGKKAYIIGEVGIEEELDLIGVPWLGGGSDAGKKIELKSGAPTSPPTAQARPHRRGGRRETEAAACATQPRAAPDAPHRKRAHRMRRPSAPIGVAQATRCLTTSRWAR